MPSNLEDSLGSALESSFTLPPPPPAPKKGSESSHEPETIPEATLEAAKSEPVEGMEEWKDTLESYNEEWQKESAIARKKALETRTRIEKENADAEKKLKDELAEKKKRNFEEQKKRNDQNKLREELEDEKTKKERIQRENKENKVKEAWELVGEKKDAKSTVETDSRATTSKDTKQEKSKPLSYDPTKSTDPIPPVFQDSSSISQNAQADSRHSTTSGAWEELSRGSPSGSGSGSSGEEVSRPQSNSEESDIVEIPSSSSKQPTSSGNEQPPSQPPSLTLSLFNPKQLTFKRVLAVIGINLFLPFVNGVFLGFGEIFAREVIRVGKLVYKGERTWYSFGRGISTGATAAGGRGTSGVGLSGGF